MDGMPSRLGSVVEVHHAERTGVAGFAFGAFGKVDIIGVR